tara:strand:+ start:1786 stop:2202 length:417 start_codon:yes stop_codon:yes gene_type:complete
MTTKIYSKVEPDKIILSMMRFNEIKDVRNNISPDEEFIQASGRILNSDFKVKAHKHKVQMRKSSLTQEAWVVIKGKIKAKFYDLDDKVIFETILKAGDCISIFRGGHSLEVLEDKTIFYEFKNGPYNGLEKDKVLIDG